mmetsp:Transcript_43116/g.101118  ORF Transcript_43116/g.101118 Transcript_43116/m.101118 type:complete len:104 (+) Transcript_43116:254-565(+)
MQDVGAVDKIIVVCNDDAPTVRDLLEVTDRREYGRCDGLLVGVLIGLRMGLKLGLSVCSIEDKNVEGLGLGEVFGCKVGSYKGTCVGKLGKSFEGMDVEQSIK